MEQQLELTDYIHTDLNEENNVIAGHYVLTEETRLPYHDSEFFYFLGEGVLDNSCCGFGNLSYAIVPGFIIDWKYRKTSDGFPVTRVEPIRDKALQNEIISLIEQIDTVCQVSFL
ncbi:MAG: hypothetical protein KKC46_10020 [Proteobacteria bacterium]|nr:hypothetical protein [Pseudomonadota bacterium]